MNTKGFAAASAVLMLLTLSGCRDEEPTPGALPSPAVSIDPDFSAERARAVQAMAGNGALGPQATTVYAAPESTSGLIGGACGPQQRLTSDLYNAAGVAQGWKLAGGIAVWQYAVAYKVVTAAQVVEDLAGRVTCQQYDLERDPADWRIDAGKVSVDRVADPPSYPGLGPVLMFCESSGTARCTALLSRDNLVCRVTVVAASRQTAEDELRRALPIFADRIKTAW